MALTTGTIVRTAVVLGAVGYCGWPGDGASGPAKSPARLPSVATAVLSPTIQSPPNRNPFWTADASPLKLAATESTSHHATSNAQSKPVAKPASDRRGDRHADPPAELVLNATSICGSERIAMINGHLYQPGAGLMGPGPMGPLVVQQILPYKVLLRNDSRVIELGYADRARRAESAGQDKTHAVTPKPNRVRPNPAGDSHHD